jgi:hypothetical protein
VPVRLGVPPRRADVLFGLVSCRAGLGEGVESTLAVPVEDAVGVERATRHSRADR